MKNSRTLLIALTACIGLTLLCPQRARAHRLGESYVYLSATETTLKGRIEVTFSDLNKVVPLDLDQDGTVTREEFDQRQDDAQAFLQKCIDFRSPGRPHPVVMTDVNVLELGMGTFALFSFDVSELESVPETIDVRFNLLHDVEPNHRGLLMIENNTRTGVVDNEAVFSAIFGPGDTWKTISFLPEPIVKVISEFVVHGIWHIWIGYDHILFIVALLLPSVLLLRESKWQPVSEFRKALWYVIKVITLFTIAHSITLSLAALEIIKLPATPVEIIIAISIAIAAFNNIKPFYSDKIWILVFCFGLFHGFGFANVLMPLGLNRSNMAGALFGFNVGVEIGQIAIICAVFPLLFLIRRWAVYQPIVLRTGSAALILVSLFWFGERSLHLWQRAQEKGLI